MSEAVVTTLATCERPRPKEVTSRKNTLLIRAAMEQDLVECENLITNFNADVNERGTNSTTCLHVACEREDTRMMKFFLEHDIDINAQEDAEAGGNTPLLLCLKSGFDDGALFLMNNGADVDIPDTDGSTPLHIATMKGNLMMVQELLNRGANVEKIDSGGKSAWYWANFLKLEEIKALLPEQKYNWLKYQESISPPAPKPKEDPKAAKGKKGKGGKKKK